MSQVDTKLVPRLVGYPEALRMRNRGILPKLPLSAKKERKKKERKNKWLKKNFCYPC